MLDGEETGISNCQEFPGLPDPCVPSMLAETSPALSGDGEALVVGSSYSSWDIPIDQGGSQDIEGDE